MNKGANKELKGKEFIESLSKCNSAKEIFGLLSDTMDNDVLRNRLQNVKDNKLIVALQANAATVNAKKNFRTSHQDCLNMAADKYCKMTGKDIKYFKIEMNKHLTKEELLHSKSAQKQQTETKSMNKPKVVTGELGM